MVCGGGPGLAEENRLISSRTIAKVRFQPVDETFAVIYICRFDSPFEAVGIAVRASREYRRKPALQPQECRRRETVLFITHDDAHRRRVRDRGRRTRRLRAGMGPAPSRAPLQSHGAYPRSHGRAEYEERGLEFQSAGADFPDATQGAQADGDLCV